METNNKLRKDAALITLNNIASECKNRSNRMLKTLNKLRVMNGKQAVSSFEEHRASKT